MTNGVWPIGQKCTGNSCTSVWFVLFVTCLVFPTTFIQHGYAAEERTPVVFIPGILGSVLARRDDPKDIVFGILPDSIDRFAELQLPWDLSENSLVSVDIVREVKGPKGGDQYNLFIQRMANRLSKIPQIRRL